MSSPGYKVHSYFINVGIGDCGIHLLLDENNRIESSVLIDGGLHTATKHIQTSIKALAHEFNPGTGDTIKFDSVVVTHWDDDHYLGTMDLFCSDLESRIQQPGNEVSDYIDPQKTVFYYPKTGFYKTKRGMKYVLNHDGFLRMKYKQGKKTFESGPLCVARASSECLGRDFFRHNAAQVKATSLATVCTESKWFKPGNLPCPIFLCIGADKKFISQTHTSTTSTTAATDDLNPTSIMAVVIWPSGNNMLAIPRISLYTGGDAGEAEESVFLKWAGENSVIEMIKAGHHGSHFSTHEDLLKEGLKCVIISAGEDHGHPSFSLTYFILTIASYRESKHKSVPSFLAMRPPYWLKYLGSTETAPTTDFNIRKVLSYEADPLHVALETATTADIVQETLQEAIPYVRNWAANTFLNGQDQKAKLKILLESPNKQFVLDDERFGVPQIFKNQGMGGLTIAKQANSQFVEAEQEVLEYMLPLLRSYSEPKPAKKDAPPQKETWGIQAIATASGVEHEVVKYPDDTVVQAKRTFNYHKVSKRRRGKKSRRRYLKMYTGEGNGDSDEEDNKKKKNKKVARETKDEKVKRKRNVSDANNMFFAMMKVENTDATVPRLRDSNDPVAREKELLEAFITDVDDLPSSGSSPNTLAQAWFQDCIGASTIFVDKHQGPDGQDVVSKITITGSQSQQPGTSSETPRFAFTIDIAARETQFNTPDTQVTQQQTPLGYDPRTDGLVLALDTMQHFTLSDMMIIVQYSAVPWIADLLNGVSLEAPLPGSRSGLWFHPDADMYTILRIQARVGDLGAAGNMADLVRKVTQLEIEHIDVVGFATFRPAAMAGETMIVAESKISFHVALGSAPNEDQSLLGNGLAMVLTTDGVEFTLELASATNPLEAALKWVNQRLHSLNSDQLSSSSPVTGSVNAADPVAYITQQFESALRTLSSNFEPRRIRLAVGAGYKLTHCAIDIQSRINKGAPEGKHVPILFSLYWAPGLLEIGGQIWNQPKTAMPFNINPFQEDFLDLKFDTTDTANGISIPLLISAEQPIVFPAGIPSIIKQGCVKVTVTDGAPIIMLEGTVVCDIPDLSTDIPTIWLDELYVRVQYQPPKNIFIQFRGAATVNAAPNDEGDYSKIGMRVLAAYENSDGENQWRITATANNIQMADLFSFFREDGSNYSITDFMSQLAVPYVEVAYVYQSGQPSELLIRGSIKLGPIMLNLRYDQRKGEEWSFQADVVPEERLQKEEVTMRYLLEGLLDDLDSVPEFITNLAFTLENLNGGIKCYSVTEKSTTGRTIKYAVFSLELQVAAFSFTFAQIQRYDNFETGQMKPPTRILRFGISGFPQIDNVNVLGSFKPPFDELDVLWVSADLTRPELDILNKKAFAGHSPLLYQDNAKVDPKSTTRSAKSPVLLKSGCHFQVLLHEANAPSLVLDYSFRKSKQDAPDQKPSNRSRLNDVPGPMGAGSARPDTVEGDAALAPLTKTAGPISVRSIGMKAVNANKIVITLDASISMGPVGLALLGFAVGFDFSNVKSPSQLMNVKPEFALSGMAVSFDRPPARLAGVFLKTSKETEYRGGIAISIGAWSAMAVGAYEESLTYKSLFVFGILQGPLMEFGCAEINGVAGGFGYNSHLALPDVSHVGDFPLVAMNRDLEEPKGDIMIQLMELTSGPGMQCVSPQKDSLWLAGGISIKAFQMLDILAVIALDLSSNPKFGLIAEATAVVPKGAKREDAFVVLELDLVAVLDPSNGLLTVAGQLTPRSYILSPSCKVTGGFCMAYYFDGSGHEGDWVLSIGGYHPSFQPPAHYPPTPPRAGISWVYDNELSITGEAYFAITPDACMGGGRLDIVFCSGRTKANFSAYVNFLMHFRPFQFQSEVGVSVFASSVVGLGFLSKEVHVEIDAMVELHGPPIAGVAHLHFWFLDISVRFGPERAIVKKLNATQFMTMIKQAKTDEDAANVEDHLFSISRGVIATGIKAKQEPPDGAEKAGISPKERIERKSLEEHLVRASQLQLNIQTRFPILTASCNGKPATIRNKDSIYISPMHIANPITTSEFRVTITEIESQKSFVFTQIPLVKNVPSAIWRKYDGEINPNSLGKSTTRSYTMGIILEPDKGSSSGEGLAAISVVKFSSQSILHPVPQIKPPETTQMAGRSSPSSSQQGAQGQAVKEIMERSEVVSAQQNVLDYWTKFRAKYTGGGRQLVSSQQLPTLMATKTTSANTMLEERFRHAMPLIYR